ncbi:hypothetical protein C7434_4347 [Pantoea sp. PNA 14-12]|uniref:hypothetical protein n=1 Tax=Pantoea TaxID=53335 RepID=UPI00050DAE83|nr:MULTISPECIES: hypothetical protein [Pantoea]KGD81418.1 hypothetical protein HA47_21160 [Pantoea stewartii subsp. indologenes]TDS65166.1 hypothetical protein C7434_4347 [Pantoea sp. PNA 14-12]
MATLTQDIGFKIIGLMNYLSGAYVACSSSGKRSGAWFRLGTSILRKIRIIASAASSAPPIIMPFITVELHVVVMLLIDVSGSNTTSDRRSENINEKGKTM